ncbi:indolepyruvate oxidoreductase subunit beta [Slackia heliotrinireducens]|uniref:indolepyruvate oxidoreductase subunit beta n=1 Tax=Slackia heliotrinireducens TaxID=84110 RepID=UPI00331605E4
MADTKTILICGVGGQGALLAADLLARATAASGQQVKVSEIHGMAQRGGSVTTVVRIGDDVKSMVADTGAVDYLISFETIEALRNISFLREDGTLIVADETIKSLPVAIGKTKMPARVHEQLNDAGALLVDAEELAFKAGSTKAVNVVLLGVLSYFLPYEVDTWNEVIAKRVPPKFKDINLAAFAAGRAFAEEHVKA